MVRALTVAVTACMVAACASEEKAPAFDRAAFGDTHEITGFEALSEDVLGLWRSEGYGWIFDITPDGMTQYQVTQSFCFETPEAARGLTDTLALDYRYYRTAPGGDALILQLLPDDTEIFNTRIDALPGACTDVSPERATPSAVFDYFAELVAENYAFFEVRDIDWQARVAAARGEVSDDMTDAALFDVIAGMIDGFSDSHTKLIAPMGEGLRRQQDGLGETLSFIRGEGRETEWLIGIFTALQEEILDAGSQHVANDRILWGTIGDGRVGYIQILQMGGFSGVDIGDPTFREAEFAVFDEVMDAALTAIADSEFVILDLSNNRGGYDAISRRLASRFTGQAFEAYATEVPGTGVPARERVIAPADHIRYTGPVKLLTSDVTVSGGEIATVALRQLPNVTHYGATTRGSFSTVLSKPLPNGWVAELSNERFLSPDGVLYEETGITPDVALEVFPLDDPIGGHRRAVEALLAPGEPAE